MIDQHATHRRGNDGKKVGSILPGDIRRHQPQKSLVHELGRHEGMSRAFSAEVATGVGPEGLIDQRRELLEGLGIAGAPGP